MEIHLKQKVLEHVFNHLHHHKHIKLYLPLSILGSQNICNHSYLYDHYCKDSPGCAQPEKKIT